MELLEIDATKKLSDADLTTTLKKAIAAERRNIAASIACLIEITARDLHTRLGASSLFVYLTRELKMSESSASKRCAAIRAVRDFPQILPLIQSGYLHLSNISLISRHLTRENAVRLIGLAQTETQRGLEKALAVEFPVRANATSCVRWYTHRSAAPSLCELAIRRDLITAMTTGVMTTPAIGG